MVKSAPDPTLNPPSLNMVKVPVMESFVSALTKLSAGTTVVRSANNKFCAEVATPRNLF